MDEYLTSLRQSSKPFLEEEKRQGLIVHYKFFIKETKNNPQDWDVCLAIQYKNHAALDALGEKTEAVRDKIFDGKQQPREVGEKREEIRELISSELLQEFLLIGHRQCVPDAHPLASTGGELARVASPA